MRPFSRRASRAAASVGLAALVAACGAAAPQTAPIGGGSGGPTTASASTSATAKVAGTQPLSALATLPPPPIDLSRAPARVHLDGETTAAMWIGPTGGAVSATAADGTTYTLSVPPDAVDGPTPISMTPVRSIDDTGLSGGFAGAVYLQPVGQVFAVPATLRITSSRQAAAGTRLVGFDLADDGGTLDLIPAAPADDGSITEVIFHFSAPGAAWGSTEDLKLLAPTPLGAPGADTRLSDAVSQLLAEDTPWSVATMADAYAYILAAWSSTFEDQLTTVSGDDNLIKALANWRQIVLLINLLDHRGNVQLAVADGAVAPGPYALAFNLVGVAREGTSLAAARIAEAIGGNRRLCNASHDLNALANMAFWADIGRLYAPDARSWDGVTDACATIDFGAFDPPTNLDAGLADSAQLSFVLKFTDGTQVPSDFEAQLDGQGFSFTSAGSTSMQVGDQASAILAIGMTGTAAGPYFLAANACWWLAGVARGVCNARLGRSFGAASTNPPAPVATPAGSGLVDWSAPCMGYTYGGTYTDLTVPSRMQHPGVATILTACRNAPTVIEGLVMDGFDITQERIVFKIEGGVGGFTATELGCPGSGLPNNGCSGATMIKGSAGSALSFSVVAPRNNNEVDYSFTGQLTGSFKSN
jgi:hypothetical protein